MAPPSYPSPVDVQVALAHLLRVGSSLDLHGTDICELEAIATTLASGRGVSESQRARVVAAQKELIRAFSAAAPLQDPDFRNVDEMTAVQFSLERRRAISDRSACSVLSSIVDAGSKHKRIFLRRLWERLSVEAVNEVSTIYSEVRAGVLLPEEQRKRLRAAMRGSVSPAKLEAMTQSDQQIRGAGGPRDCAIEQVSSVFEVGQEELRDRCRRPHINPVGEAPVAFARIPDILSTTAYALRAIGWTDLEVERAMGTMEEIYGQSWRLADQLERYEEAARHWGDEE